MPAFQHSDHGAIHLPNPVVHHQGDGYKDAIYEDFPTYSTAYQEYQSSAPHTLGHGYSHQSDPYPVPTHHMYSQPSGFPMNDWYPDHPCIQASMPAPIMAPIRVDERYVPTHPAFAGGNHGPMNFPEVPFPKEEKATGGVSAKLDYDMEQMTDFVAESTVSMYGLALQYPIAYVIETDLLRSIKPTNTVQPSFRKWVLQVLNATRLPSATIVLSLSYLAIRIRQLNAEGSLRPNERTFYKMITVALILGSKFLDDNTFQNKSWAEVSNIPVAELNQDERDWLMGFGHRLHHDPKQVDGFDTSLEQWKAYQAEAQAQAQARARASVRLPALQPLDTNLRHHRSMQALSSAATYYGDAYPKRIVNTRMQDPALYGHSYQTPNHSQYNPWSGSAYRSSIDHSPLSSASHSGPHTPEYINGGGYGWGPFNQYPSRGHYGFATTGSYTPHSALQQPGYPLPTYRQCNTAWNAHGNACQCPPCRQHHNLMPMRLGNAVVA